MVSAYQDAASCVENTDPRLEGICGWTRFSAKAILVKVAAIIPLALAVLIGSAQDEGTKGKHSFLGGGTVVRWRTQPYLNDQDNPYQAFNPSFGNSLTYGIHSHLLHNGWILNWGYGDEVDYETNQGENYPRKAYNPCLLWNPFYENSGDRGVFGYRLFLSDGAPNTSAGSAHVFCGGSAFDMHGNLITAGGQVQTLDANFMPFKKRGHPNIFKFEVGTPANPDDFNGAVTGASWLQYLG